MGLATVKALLDGGATVLLTGRNEKNLAEVRDALKGRAQVLRTDTADLQHIQALKSFVEKDFGPIDFLHYNAGTARLETFEAITPEIYDETFNVNTKGAFFTVQQLAPHITDGGAIVFTSSVADEGGIKGMTLYSGSKAALRSFAAGMAADLMHRNIRVNVVSPGFIKTPTMGVPGLTAEQRKAFEDLGDARTPMKRHGSAEEVAKAVLFLAFDATFTTGARLLVDGGLQEIVI